MFEEDKSLINYSLISWLLVVIILLLALLPAHYHLHHDDHDNAESGVSSHAYTLDLHVLAEHSGKQHHDDAVTTIPASPDGILKQSGTDFYFVILLTIVVLQLPAAERLIHAISWFTNSTYSHLHYFTPLLRAPPLH